MVPSSRGWRIHWFVCMRPLGNWVGMRWRPGSGNAGCHDRIHAKRRHVCATRRLAQSVALRFGFQYGILALLCLSPDAISHPASCSLSLLAPIVARSSLIVAASAETSTPVAELRSAPAGERSAPPGPQRLRGFPFRRLHLRLLTVCRFAALAMRRLSDRISMTNPKVELG
jgi:hypothetical protein